MRADNIDHVVTSCVFYLGFCLLCWPVVRTQDQRCNGRVTNVNVTSTGGVLYSPGYPEEYRNSELCIWILMSLEAGKVLQLRPLDLKLGQKTHGHETCSGDVLTAFDGNSTDAPILHQWCGQDIRIVHSTKETVLLQLQTSHQRRYRGFAIKYSLLTLSDNSCEGSYIKTIPLENNAVVVDFIAPRWTFHAHLPSTCSWRLVADDVTRHVVIDLENLDKGLPCEKGNFSIYDGPETSSPEVIRRWCAHGTKPFTSVYLSGSQGMVVIRTKPNVTSALRFRFYTRPKYLSTCSLAPAQMPMLELKEKQSILFTLPFALNASGVSCPVRLLSATTQHLWARIDLLQIDGQTAVCNHTHTETTVAVLQSNETDGDVANATIVQSACWKGRHPVYWPMAESVILSPSKEGRRALLKVTQKAHGTCHGRVLHRTAPSGETIVIRDPPMNSHSLHYASNSWCRFVIGGENEGDHVLSRVEGELCELEESCTDYIRIYDGSTIDDPLLYDSDSQNHVTAYVVSSGRYVTYEVSTDDKANRGFIQAEFNSVPDTDLCLEVKKVKATATRRHLSSVNYPNYYPVNYMCQYCITSDNPDDVIYIQVIDSDMTYSCSDTVEVYDGSDSSAADTEYLGRICGQDTPQFVSKRPGVCLLFRSDPALHGRGWHLSYHAGPPPAQGNASAAKFTAAPAVEPTTAPASADNTAVVILAVLLAVVTIILIIVAVIFVVKTRRQEISSV